jgi:hypothetical protein
LRGVRYLKLIVNRVTRYPDNSVETIYDERDEIAHIPRELAIDEIILQLLAAAEPHRPNPVARPTAPDRQRTGIMKLNENGAAGARGCTFGSGRRRGRRFG